MKSGTSGDQGAVALSGHLAGAQRIIVGKAVVRRLNLHRQTSPCAKEAGGQLFGLIAPDVVEIAIAVGPRKQDERSRTSFRSNPKLAQKEIERQHRLGNDYLGEWHTHAEAVPRFSGADSQTMEAIRRLSRLGVSSLVLLIRGTAPLPRGIAAYYVLGERLTEVRLELSQPTLSSGNDLSVKGDF